MTFLCVAVFYLDIACSTITEPTFTEISSVGDRRQYLKNVHYVHQWKILSIFWCWSYDIFRLDVCCQVTIDFMYFYVNVILQLSLNRVSGTFLLLDFHTNLHSLYGIPHTSIPYPSHWVYTLVFKSPIAILCLFSFSLEYMTVFHVVVKVFVLINFMISPLKCNVGQYLISFSECSALDILHSSLQSRSLHSFLLGLFFQ